MTDMVKSQVWNQITHTLLWRRVVHGSLFGHDPTKRWPDPTRPAGPSDPWTNLMWRHWLWLWYHGIDSRLFMAFENVESDPFRMVDMVGLISIRKYGGYGINSGVGGSRVGERIVFGGLLIGWHRSMRYTRLNPWHQHNSNLNPIQYLLSWVSWQCQHFSYILSLAIIHSLLTKPLVRLNSHWQIFFLLSHYRSME